VCRTTPVGGFLRLLANPSEMHISNLAIRPELAGALGHLLLKPLSRLRPISARRAQRSKCGGAMSRRRLYTRAGFYEAGVRRNYYTKPVEDALVLSLDSLTR
jgi:hypothetical protein